MMAFAVPTIAGGSASKDDIALEENVFVPAGIEPVDVDVGVDDDAAQVTERAFSTCPCLLRVEALRRYRLPTRPA